ncbi:MAG: hypothetical protein IJP31_08440 [Lachnospiraceae bacterium]|nr:hypothetical protein [Lachnospiraceae bacterium]
MKKAEYLHLYFENIHFQGKLQLTAIRMIAEEKGQGAEYMSCSYDRNDEDYKEGYVTLYFWKPAVGEDTMIHVDNLTFFNKLAEVCEIDCEKYPEHRHILDEYLKTIKRELFQVILDNHNIDIWEISHDQ